MRRLTAVFKADGTWRCSYVNPADHPSDYPCAGDFEEEGDFAVMVFDDGREFPISSDDDHNPFHSAMETHALKGDGLECRITGKKSKCTITPKSRMKGGVLEDHTVHGWRRRAVFEPMVDDDGEEIEGPDGIPEGEWYAVVPRGFEGKQKLVAIGAPAPGDRQVWKGVQAKEIEPEQGVIPEEADDGD